MTSPFFTAVIPTFNREGFIKETILSLLNQDFTDYEVIVVDDGSTDATESVVKSIVDPRVHYIKKINGERGAARNFGSARALGSYINFFDSDDLAFPNHFQTAKNVITRLENPEVFHLGYDIRSPDGRVERVQDNLGDAVNDRLINGNYLSCNGVFLRKDIAQQYLFNEERSLSGSEDYELWLRLASRFKFYCDNTVTTSVINHDGRSVVSMNHDKLIGRIEVLIKYLTGDPEFVQRYGQNINSFKSYLYIYLGLHLGMADASLGKSAPYLMRAAALYPPAIFTRRFLAALKNILIT